jgi:TolA-binding protein
MFFRSTIRVLVVLAATAALGQSANPGTTPGAPTLNRPGLTPRRGQVGSRSTDPQGLVAMRQQVEDMQSTVSHMRGVLQQMQTKAAKNKPIDSLTKANLDMWELMVGHLDKELEQLRGTLAAREDLEARRAALYKQADAKAEAAAQAGRAAQAARFAEAQQNATGTGTPTPAPTPKPAATGESPESSPAPQPAPSAAPPTNSSASPN